MGLKRLELQEPLAQMSDLSVYHMKVSCMRSKQDKIINQLTVFDYYIPEHDKRLLFNLRNYWLKH
jgi:hypothetical protein